MDYDKSEIAAIYDEARALTPERARQWRDVLASSIDPKNIRVIVDLGCGTGRFTELLATHFDAQIIGIDPSLKMIAQARARRAADTVEFRQASAEALPLTDRTVDLVFMSQICHHLTDRAAAAGECRRVLRRGGQVCIRNTTRQDDFVYRHFFSLQALIASDLPSREEIEDLFVTAGLTLTARRIVTQVVSSDWPNFVRISALRADSFLARLSDADFERGMAALRAHGAIADSDEVTEEIDWFVFRTT